MSKWEEFQLNEKITQILRDVPEADPAHHLGYPYLTAYQIAIEFARCYPEDFSKLNMPIGGRGNGQPASLAQYLARTLSQLIKSGSITQIEGGFLSNQHLCDINFQYQDEVLHSSLTGSSFTLSMFRFKG